MRKHGSSRAYVTMALSSEFPIQVLCKDYISCVIKYHVDAAAFHPRDFFATYDSYQKFNKHANEISREFIIFVVL